MNYTNLLPGIPGQNYVSASTQKIKALSLKYGNTIDVQQLDSEVLFSKNLLYIEINQ